MPNTFGTLYTLTTFGESHGIAIGGIIDGMPPGIDIDIDFIQNELNRRKPGQSKITTERKETDKVELLSGIFEGKSTGAPIGFVVRNEKQQPKDYKNISTLFRPSHADYTYYKKYVLRKYNISIQAYTSQVGNIALERDYKRYDLSLAEKNAVRCPDEAKAKEMEDLIATVKSEGDTIGGIITCVVKGCPIGLGEPEFGKLHAQLGAAMLSINAAKGFEYGEGFDGSTWRGSQQNDCFIQEVENENSKIAIQTNHSGGIQGGISNGEDIFFRVAFKPIATLRMEQETVDFKGNKQLITVQGRHDSCVLPRAVPIVEAMTAMTILDAILVNNSKRI